jgi:hypothetical protein
MMYILTQEEFEAFQLKKRNADLEATKVLQDLCTRVADSEILTEGSMRGKPWGCILTHKNKHWCGYCDKCPVRDVCPYDWKEWSK